MVAALLMWVLGGQSETVPPGGEDEGDHWQVTMPHGTTSTHPAYLRLCVLHGPRPVLQTGLPQRL